MKRAKSESPGPCDTQITHSDTKRSRVCDVNKEYEPSLLNLSDDVLLHIFKYLPSFDLMSLHLCCFRLYNLCCDRTLWKNLDLRSQCLSFKELEKYVKFMQPVTTCLALRGIKIQDELPELQISFLEAVNERCNDLQEFILEKYTIPRDTIQITNFPKTLKKLSLESCQVSGGLALNHQCRSYLHKIDTHMPHLTSLILTNCNWINFNSFMAISKIPNLRELRLNSCHGLSEEIAYPSIACRYGLKTLEVLDLRDTFIGDSVISSFSYTSTLTEFYLECPSSDTIQIPAENAHGQQDVLYVHLPHLQLPPDVIEQVQVIERNINDVIFGNADRCQISDRSICSLGLHANEDNHLIIQNRNEVQLVQGRRRTLTNPYLKKLVIRNYAGVTNQILLHFVANGPNLEYLDVTGTSVTKEGVQCFKLERPNVNLISSFDEIS